MKKHICILLAVLMILCFSTTALASGNVTAAAEFSYEKNAIIVSGTAASDRANVRLALEIKNPDGKTVYADQTVAVFNEAGDALVFEFEPVALHPKNITGTYSIIVSGDRVGTAATVYYDFKGADLQLLALGAVMSAITSQNDTQLSTAIAANGTALGIDSVGYAAMGAEGKQAANKILFAKTYAVPEDILTDENIDTVQSSVAQLRTDFGEALKIGKFNDIVTDDNIESWLKAYGTTFSEDIPGTAIAEDTLYPYIADALSEEDKLALRISGGDMLLSMDDIRNELYEQALLTIIENRHFSEGRTIFESFPTLFGINTSKLNSLNDIAKGEVWANAKGAYATVAAAGQAVNSLIDSYASVVSGGGSPSGGSSRGGGGGFSVSENMAVPEDSSASTGFADLAYAEWAREAVESLYKKGIVSGDENGNFNPNSYIIRAEFIKLVVLAIGADMNVSAPEFSDVASDAWYKPYVNAARAFGLAVGDENNCFHPNAFITREDMAVMLYRSYKIAGEVSYPLSFNDSENISEYAKEAVAFLSAKSIVNGVGENNFAPKDNATRAAAAQIIYKTLNRVK